MHFPFVCLAVQRKTQKEFPLKYYVWHQAKCYIEIGFKEGNLVNWYYKSSYNTMGDPPSIELLYFLCG